MACSRVGRLHLRRGELQKAISVLRRAIELIRAWNIPTWFPLAVASLGYSLTLVGSLSEGMQLLDAALQRSVVIPFMIGYSLWLTWLGEAHLLAGRMEEAGKVAEQAVKRCRDCGERAYMAWALRLLGEIASSPDRPDVETGENYFWQAIGLAEELGMRPLIAHCHLGFGRLYRPAGKRTQAQDYVTSAATMYREMDMPFWLENALADI